MLSRSTQREGATGMHMPWSPLRSAVLGAAALTVMAATAVPAQADPQLWIGLQAPGVNGGNITPFAGGTVEYGHFGVRPAGGFASGQLPTAPPLLADAMVVSVDTPGTLIVWITITGYLPLGAQALESSFTQNQLPEGWTVRVETFLDPNNGVFSTAVPLSSHLFTDKRKETFHEVVPVNLGTVFYSVTVRFTYASGGVGTGPEFGGRVTFGSTITTADIDFAPRPKHK